MTRLEAIQIVRDAAADHLRQYLEALAGYPRYDREIAELKEAIRIVDGVLKEMGGGAVD